MPSIDVNCSFNVVVVDIELSALIAVNEWNNVGAL